MVTMQSHNVLRLKELPVARVLSILCLSLPLLVGCGGGEGDSAAQAQGRGGPGGGKPAQAPVAVAVETASRGPISSYYSATASLDPNKQADVLARVAGVVTSIRAEEGDRVSKGADLLRIEEREFQLRLAQAEAEAAKQKTKYERLDRMFKENLISADEFETTTNDFAAAEASRDLAKLELSYTRVVAPFDGRVTQRFVDPGQTVSNGTALFSLVDVSRLLARVHVPAREFREIQTDQTVLLKVDSTDQRLSGRIQLVSPVVDPTSGTIKVTVEIDEYPGMIRPGDFAEVLIVTDRHENAVLVPKTSVVTDKGDRIVYVAAADSTAERRLVTVGFEDEEHAEILTGLTEGEPVVVQGQRSLREGAPIKIMERLRYADEASSDTTLAGS